MQTEYVLFTVAVEIVGFLLLFQNFRDWKKGITHIRYYPFLVPGGLNLFIVVTNQ